MSWREKTRKEGVVPQLTPTTAWCWTNPASGGVPLTCGRKIYKEG